MVIKQDQMRFVSSAFSVFFDTNTQIRRYSNEIEDKLNKWYQPPAIIPVPEQMNPEIPRIVCNAKNGQGSAAFSLVSATLAVKYTEDFYSDYILCQRYLQQRVDAITELLGIFKIQNIKFGSLHSQIRVPLNHMSIESISKDLCQWLTNGSLKEKTNEFSLKQTIIKEPLFINVTIGTYQDWKIDNPETAWTTVALNDQNAIGRGVQVNLDINTRRRFNENEIRIEDIVGDIKIIKEMTEHVINNRLIDWINGGVTEL